MIDEDEGWNIRWVSIGREEKLIHHQDKVLLDSTFIPSTFL